MPTGTADTPADDVAGKRARIARRILLSAMLLGAFGDIAMRYAPDGLELLLWVAALTGAALTIARRAQRPLTREQHLWLAIALICAATHLWRDAEDLRVANAFGTLVALGLFAMSTSGRPVVSIFAARVRDVIEASVHVLHDVMTGMPMLVTQDATLHELRLPGRGRTRTAIRTLLLSIPLVAVFTWLLSRADPVFASMFRLPKVDVEPIISHTFLTGVLAWVSAGWIRGALFDRAPYQAPHERLSVRLGLAEITTSLGAVIVLFAVFVALQVRWLFGGADVVLATTGLTIAEYARRGFFELVAVAVLVLPLILGTGAIIDDRNVIRRHRQLSLVLLMLLVPIIASALLRMQLYMKHFGLSTDRLYVTALIAWLGIVSMAMARAVLRERSRSIAAIMVISGFVTLFTLVVVNPERMVVNVNLRRSSGQAVDYAYLARLSGDAIPTVVQALNAAEPSAESCKAALALRSTWLPRTAPTWNLGARRGREAVVEQLTSAELGRLCVGMSSGDTSVVRP